MPATTLVKICGITDEDAMAAAVEGGADFVGLVFFPPSPRALSFEAAAELSHMLPEEVKTVGLFVDPDDATIERALNAVRLDLLQLHGAETPERIEQLRLEFGHPVMKSVAVATAADVDAAREIAAVADWLLFDAQAPAGAGRPGGNAAGFDWSLLAGRKWPCPWMLAGGLTPDTVAAAIRATGAPAVDVSSGVERAPGVKDPELILRFITAAKAG